MKFNKIALYVAAVLSFGGASCSDYLDKEVDLTLQADNVFSDFDRTHGFLAKMYDNCLPDAFRGYSDTQFRLSGDCMTDNAVDYWLPIFPQYWKAFDWPYAIVRSQTYQPPADI